MLPLPRPSPLPLYGLMPGPFGTLIKYLKYQYCFTPTIIPVTWRTIQLVPCILSLRVICIPLFPSYRRENHGIPFAWCLKTAKSPVVVAPKS